MEEDDLKAAPNRKGGDNSTVWWESGNIRMPREGADFPEKTIHYILEI